MKRPTLLFWLCTILVGAEMMYGLYWAIPNVGLRLGWLPTAMSPDLAALIPTLRFWQEFLFFGHVALNIGAFIALLQQWAACIPLFLTAFLFDRIDWIIMGTNPLAGFRNDSVGDWISFIAAFGGIGLMAILQVVSLVLMGWLLQRDQLSLSRRKRSGLRR